MWSTDILTKVLDTAGSSFWPIWKTARERQGLPPLDAPEPRTPANAKQTHPSKSRALAAKARQVEDANKEDAAEVPTESVVDLSKTGAARILP
jgi:hypothetical protein